jgi:hypothetical protein
MWLFSLRGCVVAHIPIRGTSLSRRWFGARVCGHRAFARPAPFRTRITAVWFGHTRPGRYRPGHPCIHLDAKESRISLSLVFLSRTPGPHYRVLASRPLCVSAGLGCRRSQVRHQGALKKNTTDLDVVGWFVGGQKVPGLVKFLSRFFYRVFELPYRLPTEKRPKT